MTDKDLVVSNQLKRIQIGGAILGVCGAIALSIGSVTSTEQFFESYLFAYLFCLSIPLGCLGLLMLHHMVSGRWGYAIQRLLEAGARTLPFMALLFLPIAAHLSILYPWVRSGEGGAVDSAVVWSQYLNTPFFLLRFVFYFVLWSGAAYLLSYWSVRQDETGDPRYTVKLRLLSAPGLVVYGLTATLAAVDWVMSLEPGWSSTIYGLMFIVGEVLAALVMSVIMLRVVSLERPFSEILTTKHVHFLGNLILTCVFLWAYMAYSQWIIIWSGNLPDENSWYLHRLAPGWSATALCLIIFHFFVPFFILLVRSNKQSLKYLSYIAFGILFMRVVDMYWLVMPAFHPSGFIVTWLDVAALFAFGGAWVFAFVALVRRRPLLPAYDPRFMRTSAAFEH